jgi:DNA helicase-2/ATP-dependent DNA helicase PcrA
VFDFKTGKPASNWKGSDVFEKIKLHKYRQQLLFYKLLVENSASYQSRLRVETGRLEFIEADANGRLSPGLELKYDPDELDRFLKLITAVWKRIMGLDFPDTSQYPRTLEGILQFEDDLINENTA